MASPTSTTPWEFSEPSGSTNIDALAGGIRYQLTSLTFSFAEFTSVWSSGYSEPLSADFDVLAPSDRVAVRGAMAAWEAVSGLQFTEVAETATLVGDLRLGYTGIADPGVYAYASLPGSGPRAGDIWFNAPDSPHGDQWDPGSYAYFAALHEIGHALGLKHPFAGNPRLSPELDHHSFTVMSYTGSFSYYPTTPMVLDIAAIQHLYGVNTTINAGNTTYEFTGTSDYHFTVWDASGIDTFVYLSSSGGEIDLRAGTGGGSRLGKPVQVWDANGTRTTFNVWIAYGTVIENATGGSGNDTLSGNDVGNRLQGGAGNDTLSGLAGNDTLIGGTGTDTTSGGDGNDTYVVDTPGDIISEVGTIASTSDLVQSGLSWTLGANLERLTLTGTAAISGTGNTLANLITGNGGANTLAGGSGNDTLNGGVGADSLIGGSGNDTYHVDNTGDVVNEGAGAGTDTLVINRTATLSGQFINIENLTLGGSSAINGTGNALANLIIGNSAANTLAGGSGDDTLNGGVGADSLIGGAGNDTYHVDNPADVVNEGASAGFDTLVINRTTTLSGPFANIENLTLSGSSAINGTGNTLANAIKGNGASNTLTGDSGNDTLDGAAGNDTLDGGAGNDSMIGGSGNDTYVVSAIADIIAEAGTSLTEVDMVQSTVSWTLGANIERLALAGTAAINGTGNALANLITGNGTANALGGDGGNDSIDGGAGNDSIDGGAGNDSMTGGDGNDTYVVDTLGDSVHELGAVGSTSDLVRSAVTWTLGANLERLTLTGTAAINGTGNALANLVTGNIAANLLAGGGGNDTLNGSTGNDTLNGGLGNDSMNGGAGNDTYVVDATNDVTAEAGSSLTEIDTVQSSVSRTLGANLERLTLTGIAAINGAGNTLANLITGNGAANLLTGSGGDDTLNGGSGNDTLSGGLGNDSMNGGSGNDFYVVDATGDVTIEAGTSQTEIDTVQSAVSRTLGANLERLTLTGTAAVSGTGNTLDNLITGNDGANALVGGAGDDTLDGGGGDDSLVGGSGNDSYLVDASGDQVVETDPSASEVDTVTATTSWTLGANLEHLVLGGTVSLTGNGNALANRLIGNAGANVLNGLDGNDTLFGGEGGDSADGGNGDDSLEGGLGNDGLLGGAGNDTLRGDAGTDTMVGGDGADRYYIDSDSDQVIETSSLATEIDTVVSTASWVLGANVENLTLDGIEGTFASGNELANLIDGSGGANQINGNAGNDTIHGNAGSDTVNGGDGDDILDGGTSADTLAGDTGDDQYIVDDIGDQVFENPGEGLDTISTTLAALVVVANVERLSYTGNGNFSGTGNSLANELTSGDGNDTLDGGTGNDTMQGGAGDDRYRVDSGGDTVVDRAGVDEVLTTMNAHILDDGIETLRFTGSGAFQGEGNNLDNRLEGGTGNDSLNGLAGIDTAVGGAGDDTYSVDVAQDVVHEVAGEGLDVVNSLVTWTLGEHFEWLFLAGGDSANGTGNAAANRIVGNDGVNVLTGLDGNDTLDGGTGIDTMNGGAGNDVYVVDNAGDLLSETSTLASEIDSVHSSITWTLGTNLENLTLTGSAAINGTGNGLANTITGNDNDNVLAGGIGNDALVGNAGNDSLDGSSGDDTLRGGAGADSLTGGLGIDLLEGGLGDDTYAGVDTGDTLSEAGGDGNDLVTTALSSYTLGADLERLTYTGGSGFQGFGNSLANTLTGAVTNDSLDGGSGADAMFGLAGGDVYFVDNAGDGVNEAAAVGTDEIRTTLSSYTIVANVERLTYIGAGSFSGTGLAGNETITGGAGNDTLDGAAGSDTLVGGAGNDLYIVDTGDLLSETSTLASEIDSVHSSITWTLGTNLENLTLTGSAAINGTGNGLANTITGNDNDNVLAGGIGNDALVGNAGNDSLDGSSGDDTLRGGAGADSLTGGLGIDLLEGGLGDDTYAGVDTGDTLSEAGGDGNDLVTTALSSYTLGADLERLTYTGGSGFQGFGNSLANTLTGAVTNDSLDGGSGADAMFGLAGGDVYFVDNAGDGVNEAAAVGTDEIRTTLSSYTIVANVERLTYIGAGSFSGTGLAGNETITGGAGNDTLDGAAGSDTLVGGAGNDLYIVDTGDLLSETSTLASEIDSVQSSITWTLGTNLENLTLTGSAAVNGTGNNLNNTITGNDNDNILAGGVGNDVLVGEAGDDSLDGSSGDDTLRGGAGADSLTGGLGIDLLEGGLGDDTYAGVDTGDTLSEAGGDGNDLVTTALSSYTLGADLERLTYTGGSGFQGFGNSLANTLTGAVTNDSLDGGSGADAMFGLAGGDVYFVDNAGDGVNEAAAVGTDEIRTTLSSYTIVANVERLTYIGAGSFSGTGLAGNETITGGAGNDTLDGAAGSDTLVGGAGNDLYIVDTGDLLSETSTLASEIDSVQSSITWTLGTNLENLTLTGSAAVNGTGNSLNNTITGNDATNSINGSSGADTLSGGEGNDTLIGGTGSDWLTGGGDADQFLIEFATAIDNERVTDFASGTDDMAFDMSNIPIGNADTVMVATETSGPWISSAELIINTSLLTDLSTATIGAEFSSASGAISLGSRKILVASSTTAADPGTGVYLFVSDGDADVETAELTMLAFLAGTSLTSTADFLFVP